MRFAIILLTTCSASSGCASGKWHTFRFESSPPGAAVYRYVRFGYPRNIYRRVGDTTDSQASLTPYLYTLVAHANEEFTFQARLNGYESQITSV